MKPIRYEGSTAVFTSSDVDLFGLPDLYGYSDFIVIESRELVLVSDYKMERSYDLKPVHRYSRVARFKTTLLRLVGEKTKIPEHIITACRVYLKPTSLDLWNDTRRILKCYKWQKFYDFIPAILNKLGMARLLNISAEDIESILSDFKLLVQRFNQSRHLMGRKYFPNIRFIALKLLEYHGCLHDYPIPFARTERKLVSLSLLWDQLLVGPETGSRAY